MTPARAFSWTAVGLAGALAAVLGWETDWGQALRPPAADVPALRPPAVTVAVLPDYRIEGGLETMPETAARTVFVPTRRPAPPAPPLSPAEEAKSAMKKGQFLLTGTSVAPGQRFAFLKEVASGKHYRVKAGDAINDLEVAEVGEDRVRLAFEGESEELLLKVAKGGMASAVGAAIPGGAPVAGVPGSMPQGARPLPTRRVPRGVNPLGRTPSAAGGDATDGTQQTGEALRQRRTRVTPAPGASPQAGAAGGPGTASTWSQVYQRYIGRGGQNR